MKKVSIFLQRELEHALGCSSTDNVHHKDDRYVQPYLAALEVLKNLVIYGSTGLSCVMLGKSDDYNDPHIKFYNGCSEESKTTLGAFREAHRVEIWMYLGPNYSLSMEVAFYRKADRERWGRISFAFGWDGSHAGSVTSFPT
jgi:hypothetical protein